MKKKFEYLEITGEVNLEEKSYEGWELKWADLEKRIWLFQREINPITPILVVYIPAKDIPIENVVDNRVRAERYVMDKVGDQYKVLVIPDTGKTELKVELFGIEDSDLVSAMTTEIIDYDGSDRTLC